MAINLTCAACGARNPPGSTFCQTCARRLDAATGEEIANRRQSALSSQTMAVRWTAVIVSTAVVIIVVVLVLVLVVHI